jgi:hypothetical protein
VQGQASGELRFRIVSDAVGEQRARLIGVTARVEQHGVFQHRAHAGIGVGDLDDAPRRRDLHKPRR